MKKHVKTYLNYFGYDTTDWIPCEICGKTANDIHHIEPRGMGGSKTKDLIHIIDSTYLDKTEPIVEESGELELF